MMANAPKPMHVGKLERGPVRTGPVRQTTAHVITTALNMIPEVATLLTIAVINTGSRMASTRS